jgi:hypothetical protein
MISVRGVGIDSALEQQVSVQTAFTGPLKRSRDAQPRRRGFGLAAFFLTTFFAVGAFGFAR